MRVSKKEEKFISYEASYWGQYSIGMGILMGMMLIPQTNAAGKQQSSAPPSGGAPACDVPGGGLITTPFPVRRVVLQPVGTKVFHLPNGGSADLSVDLNTILNTVVANTSNMSPTDPYQDPCNSHLEIRAAVTTFQLNVAEIGLSIGYTPSGELGPIAGVQGKVNAKIGTIAMDFSVWQCTHGVCSAVGATYASHLTAGVNLSLEIDFNVVKTGPSLVFNTPIGNVLRKIIDNGISQLAATRRLNELSWQAKVRSYVPEIGSVIFDAGSQARIQPNQAFEIYAPTDGSSSGGCSVYQQVAYMHTTQVGAVSSYGLVDKVLDSRGVQVGDIVMVRQVRQK